MDRAKEEPPLPAKRRKRNLRRSGQVSDCSSESVKSDCSKGNPLSFSPGPGSQSGLSSVSLKSNHSEAPPLNFSPGPGPQVVDLKDLSDQTELELIFTRLEKNILTFMKQKFQKILASELPESTSEREKQSSCSETVPNITVDFLKRMDQEGLAQRLRESSVRVCRGKLKSHLRQKYSQVFEGVAKAGDSAPLQQIYTELHMTEGGASEVNQEDEVRLIESMSKKPTERTITCKDIFKQRPESEQPIRAVLTRGVAGTGKTLLTQKFSLNWAEGRTNQDIDLLFPFTFRELSVLKDRTFSLVELLHHCFSPIKGLSSFEDLQVLFVLDGLDECRLSLDFRRTRVLTDPTESASVEELLVNLIRGDLLQIASG